MKRFLALLFALAMVFTLAACGEAPADGTPAPTEAPPADTEAPPAGTEPPEEDGELTAYEIEGVGTVYLPAGGEVYIDEQTEPFPNISAA